MDLLSTIFRSAATDAGTNSNARYAAPVVAIVAIGAAAFCLFDGGGEHYVPLSLAGHAMSETQVAEAERVLRTAGLTDFRRDGAALLVPDGYRNRYTHAIRSIGASNADPAAEWERSLEQSSLFTTQSQLETMKDIARRRTIRGVVLSVPGIEDASVTWARSDTRGWRGERARVTATLSVRPRSDLELSRERIHSLQAAVGNMVADLEPFDVTVFDQSTGISHTCDEAEYRVAERLYAWHRQHTRQLRDSVLRRLDDLRNCVVSVDIDLQRIHRSLLDRILPPPTTDNAAAGDSAGSASRRVSAARYSERDFIAELPHATQVHVSIPASVCNRIARERFGVETESTVDKIDKTATSLNQLANEALFMDVRSRTMEAVGMSLPESAVSIVTHPDFGMLSSLDGHAQHGSSKLLSGSPRWALAAGLATLGLMSLYLAGRGAAAYPRRRTATAGESAEDDTDSGVEIDFRHREAKSGREEPNTVEIQRERRQRMESLTKHASRHGSKPGDIHALIGFDDLRGLPASIIQTVAAHQDDIDLAMALKGSGRETRQVILDALDASAAAALLQHIDQLGPLRVGDIEAAQAQLLADARDLIKDCDYPEDPESPRNQILTASTTTLPADAA